VAGGWRRLHNEELPKLYTSQNTITMIKSSSTHGRDKSVQNFCRKYEGNRPNSEDLSVVGKIISE
jgi:hypothetical protein